VVSSSKDDVFGDEITIETTLVPSKTKKVRREGFYPTDLKKGDEIIADYHVYTVLLVVPKVSWGQVKIVVEDYFLQSKPDIRCSGELQKECRVRCTMSLTNEPFEERGWRWGEKIYRDKALLVSKNPDKK